MSDIVCRGSIMQLRKQHVQLNVMNFLRGQQSLFVHCGRFSSTVVQNIFWLSMISGLILPLSILLINVLLIIGMVFC